MGGVCSGGTVKKSRKSVEVEHEKSSGFSGKLKSIGSFGKKKNNDDSYTYHDEIDVFEKGPHNNLYDSGELNLSISRELKPSTPARTPANKTENSLIELKWLYWTISIMEILNSEGVRQLVSTDMDELLSIAAADKRLDSDPEVSKQPREEAEMTMQELTTLAQHTSIVEKLVDIVTFIHQEISDVFGNNGLQPPGKVSTYKPERLGVAGLALHYANIITQIDNVASRPTSLPPSMRDTLYNGLPPAVKAALRSRLQTDAKEDLTVPQIKAEMEKSLQWLVPVATDTTKAHQGFGWVGEWANTGNEFGKKTSSQNNLIRLQTLYHADKRKVESWILELVTLLHRLISLVRYRDNGLKAQPARSPTNKGSNGISETLSNSNNGRTHGAQLSSEDRHLLEDVMKRRKFVPGLSKSQEFVMVKNKKNKIFALSRSTGSSPRRGMKHQQADVLDILDGLDSSFAVPR
ncbi:UNVERIFIED_CONTAM: protein PSK SIMULATOR 2 [Sesamum calycinum]|uniref:Protein PSK SIMULATOR 2 n=1 Tax=Sesamum calycinum TaxID=2727403 RepID=A0AAW2P641_9LAMI